MPTLLRVTIALALAFILVPAKSAERDGSWWIGLQQAERLAYATGFLDGNTYAAFAVSGAIRRTATDPRTKHVAEEIMHLNIDAIYAEINEVQPAQLSETVSRIYSDSKNHELQVLEVLYAAARSVRGASEAETSRFLESRRRRGATK